MPVTRRWGRPDDPPDPSGARHRTWASGGRHVPKPLAAAAEQARVELDGHHDVQRRLETLLVKAVDPHPYLRRLAAQKLREFCHHFDISHLHVRNDVPCNGSGGTNDRP